MPNVTVQVDLVGTAPRLNAAGEPDPTLPVRPAYASGSLDLRVPAYARTLAVELAPRALELEPGGETVIDVTVRDASGRPVKGAEVALIVVDEAVLALTGYELADPVALFYPDRALACRTIACASTCCWSIRSSCWTRPRAQSRRPQTVLPRWARSLCRP